MFFTSSPLPPIHWHSLQEEGKLRALTALEDKFNRNWWKWPKKVSFYYSCREKNYQGLMEPQSFAEAFCDWGVSVFTVLGRKSEESLKGKLIWTVIGVRSVLDGGREDLLWWVEFVNESTSVLDVMPMMCSFSLTPVLIRTQMSRMVWIQFNANAWQGPGFHTQHHRKSVNQGEHPE